MTHVMLNAHEETLSKNKQTKKTIKNARQLVALLIKHFTHDPSLLVKQSSVSEYMKTHSETEKKQSSTNFKIQEVKTKENNVDAHSVFYTVVN